MAILETVFLAVVFVVAGVVALIAVVVGMFWWSGQDDADFADELDRAEGIIDPTVNTTSQ